MPGQQAGAPTVKTTVDEVLLDLIVRDKKGKPVADLKPSDITVVDNGAKQTLTSFRLVSSVEAVTSSGARTALDPLRQRDDFKKLLADLEKKPPAHPK